MNLSIVIPAYNEEFRIARTLQEIRRFLAGKGWQAELVLVDDGSTDRTAETAQHEMMTQASDFSCRILRHETNRGKGASVRTGMLAAEGEFMLFTDADLSTPIGELEKLVGALEEGYDVAVGSRALPESRVEVHQNFPREMMGKIFNRIARALTFRRIRDSQCGFKLFRKEAARRLFGRQKIDGFAFDAEIIFLAQKLGYRIKEIPVVWRNSRASKVHIVWDPLKMLRDLILIRLSHMGHEKEKAEKES